MVAEMRHERKTRQMEMPVLLVSRHLSGSDVVS